MKFLNKTFLILLLSCVLMGCQTNQSYKRWPADLPPKKVFTVGLAERLEVNKASRDQVNYHLHWIARFYQGTTLYPTGWLSMSAQCLTSVTNLKRRKKIANTLEKLGIRIANEWALENGVRRINNTHMAIWAGALETAAERNDQESYLAKVSADVAGLIEQTLRADDVTYERYYEDIEYEF